MVVPQANSSLWKGNGKFGAVHVGCAYNIMPSAAVSLPPSWAIYALDRDAVLDQMTVSFRSCFIAQAVERLISTAWLPSALSPEHVTSNSGLSSASTNVQAERVGRASRHSEAQQASFKLRALEAHPPTTHSHPSSLRSFIPPVALNCAYC
jgi:hypothetical protein